MVVNDYRHGLLLFRRDGSALGSASVKIDWEPAAEWTRFYHARRGAVPLCGEGSASIEPLWDSAEGEPYMQGFRVVYDSGGRKVTSDFPSSYFSEAAAQVSAEFVKRGKLEAGDTYLFQAVAYTKNGADKPTGGLELEVVEEKPALEYVESRLDDFRRRSSPAGVVAADDMPVFIPQRVLDEAAALTRGAEGRETGGVLIGRLHHDAALPEIFAEVSAQIPAEHTQGTVAKLTFTAETWTAASAAIRLRNQAEVYLGYWHSHPVREWCRAKECTPEKQKNCRLAKDFFSEDDRAVMRAAFPRGLQSWPGSKRHSVLGFELQSIRLAGGEDPPPRLLSFGGIPCVIRHTRPTAPRLEVFQVLMASGGAPHDLEQNVGLLQQFRTASPEGGTQVDRLLVEEIGRMRAGLETAREAQEAVRQTIEELTAPPYFPAVFLSRIEPGLEENAMVRAGGEVRAVGFGENNPEQFQPGDECLLSHERNFIFRKTTSKTFTCGETASFVRCAGEGRLVIKARDEEMVVLPAAALRDAPLKAGDLLRFDRGAWVAYEKIERPRGDEYFLEETPIETFDSVGGLDREIGDLKRSIELHFHHPETVRKYRLRRKKAILLYGPPGTGKTLIARALANWLAGLSKAGRSRFINVKPAGLHSMWYGQTEANYREVFSVAREAGSSEPEVPVVIFFGRDRFDRRRAWQVAAPDRRPRCHTPSWPN